MAVEDQSYGTVQERLVLLDGQWFLIQDGVISGGAGKLYDRKEHDVYVLVLIFILHDHIQEYLIEIMVCAFAGQEDRSQGAHDQVLGNEIQQRNIEHQGVDNVVHNIDQLFLQLKK